MILCERVPCKVSWRGLLAVGMLAVVALPSWLVAESPKSKAADKPASPLAEQFRPGREVSGRVKAFDAVKNTLTLASKQLKELEKELAIAQDAKVLLDDGTGERLGLQAGKLADVAEGLPVTVRLSPDQKQIIGIWVEGPTLKGTLKAIDPAKHSVTVSVVLAKGEPEEDKTFDVAKHAQVSIAPEKGKDKSQPQTHKLTDLPLGALVVLKLSADQKTAGRIQVEMPSVRGTLKAVDAAKNRLTLRIAGKGQPEEERTYEVANDAKVTMDGTGGKLADLPTGAVVTARLSLDHKVITSIQAEGAQVRGILKAVDAAKRFLTLHVANKGEPGKDHTYDVAKDVKVTIDGAGGKLSDLPMEATATVKLSIDQKEVSAIQVEGTQLQGVVKVVDAGSRSITVAMKEDEKTLAVAEDAPISIDGKVRKLADLPVDAMVALKLSADQRTVRSLSAQGRTVKGVVTAVDDVNYEIAVDIPKEGESRFKIAEDVKVTAGEKAKSRKLADVKPDQEVALLFSADQKLVRQIILHDD